MPIVNMLFIGTFADVDTNETNFTSENQADFAGVTAGPGTLAVVEVDNRDGDNNGVIRDNEANVGLADFAVYTNPATGITETRQSDSTISVTIDVTLADGSSLLGVPAVLIQMVNGDTFITELNNDGSLDNLAIESITIASITGSFANGYFANQSVDNTVVCFVRGTMVKTAQGLVAIEDLAAGDMVLTLDHGYQPVRWIGSTCVSVETLAAHPNLRPIRIRAGALGANSPEADLLVSPQHRILVRSKIAERMFGENEALIAAKHLTAIDGIDVVDECTAPVEYFHFMCNEHQVVFSNGAPSESLYTGPEALKAVSAESRAEILSLFPELADMDYRTSPSRRLVNGRFGTKLAMRHAQNDKPLLEMSTD